MSLRLRGHRRALIRTAAVLLGTTTLATGLLATPASASVGTTMTVSPAKATKNVGEGVTFTWTLATSGGGRLAGRPVNVYTRPTTSSAWTFVGTRTTTTYGRTAIAFTVQRSTYVLAKFLGTSVYAGSSAYGLVGVSTLGQRAVTEASRHQGAPYVYGAEGPTRFDCSGLTRYVYLQLGRSLPHNSAQQYGVVRHVAKADKKVGDLIFIYSSSGIYHVGIYAGNGYFWHAPHTGDVVKKAPIYSTSYYVGRVA